MDNLFNDDVSDLTKRARTSITILPEVLDQVRVVSAQRGVSVSRFIEEVLQSQFSHSVNEDDE